MYKSWNPGNNVTRVVQKFALKNYQHTNTEVNIAL